MKVLISKNSKSRTLMVAMIFMVLAVVFTVGIGSVSADSSVIYVDGSSGDDSWDGLSWETAKLTIGNAIETVDDGGTVNIASGTYTGDGNKNINVNKSVTINGQSKSSTVIDAENEGNVFNIKSGAKVTISNLTIKNGNASVSASPTSCGGAIYSEGNLNVINCAFKDNTACYYNNSYGGAIESSGTLTIIGSTFTGNAADFSGAVDNFNGDLTITNCTFNGNTAGKEGGAIGNIGNIFSVTNCTFTNNHASYGGAILSYSDATITGSTFTNNFADNDGGAIAHGDSNSAVPAAGTLTIIGNTFTGNSASGYGGAIENYQSNINANFNRIIGNTASQGSAIYNYGLADALGYGGLVDASNNWWGSNANPISNVSSNVIVGPWIILNLTASPTTVPINGISLITADLTHNSNGKDISALGYIPDGTPINFTATSGSIDSSSTTVNGKAQATLVGSAAGTATVYAYDTSLVNAVNTNVTVISGPFVSKIDPTNSSKIAVSNPVITITFNEPIQAGSAYSNIKVITPDNKAKTITKTINGSTLTLTASYDYTDGVYTVYIPANAVKNAAGNGIVATYNSTFTVAVPPVVSKVDPVNGTTVAVINKVINITFSEAIQAGSAYNNIKVITSDGKSKIITKTISGNTLTLTSTYSYTPGTYTIYIPANAVQDLAGNGLAGNYTSIFTVNTVTPSIISVNPVNGATVSDVNKVIIITFNQSIQAGSAYNNIKVITSDGKSKIITKTISGNTLTLTPTYSYAPGTYTIYIPANAVQNTAGNGLAANYNSTFIINTVTPTVTKVDPTNESTVSDANKVITITFSESIQAGSAYNNIKVITSDGKSKIITKTISGNTLTLTANYSYTSGIYTIYIPANAVLDSSGNGLATTYNSTFTINTG